MIKIIKNKDCYWFHNHWQENIKIDYCELRKSIIDDCHGCLFYQSLSRKVNKNNIDENNIDDTIFF